MRCLRSPVAILMAFFFRQNPISSLISCVRQRGQRLEMSYLGWTVSKSLKASSGLSVRMADSYSERILSICMTADMKFTEYTSFAITAYPIHVYIDCLSTIVFILPLHLDDTKVIIFILWWRTFQLEYWHTFQLVSTPE